MSQKSKHKKLFFRAAAEGDISTLRACLEAGVHVDHVDSNASHRRTALEHAVCNRQEEAVRFLLAAGANPNDPHLRILHTTVMQGTPAILRLLLEAGARTDWEDDFHWETAFLWAAEKGKSAMVATWLEFSKAEITHCSGDWPLLYPLHLAAREGHAEVVRLLLRAGADVNLLTEDGMAPLHLCHKKLIPQLLAAGAEVNSGRFEHEVDADARMEEFYSQYRYGWTPLLCAVLRNDADLVRALLAAGADVTRCLSREGGYSSSWEKGAVPAPSAIIDPEDTNRELYVPRAATALHLAAAYASANILRLLLEHGADVHARTLQGATPLLMAAAAGKTKCVRLLLQAGARHDAADDKGNTPVELALRQGHAATVRLLLKAGASLPSYGPPLLRYFLLGEEAAFTAALEAAEEPNAVDSCGNSLLMLAVCAGDGETVRRLAQMGVDMNSCRHISTHALNLAIELDDAAMLSLLLELGADLQQLIRAGFQPLRTALEADSRRVLPSLIAAGAELTQCDDNGESVLSDCARLRAHGDFLEALLAAGADVNERDDRQATPLHHLISHHAQPEMIMLMLDAGAAPDACDFRGTTPLALAEATRQREVAAVLRACITC